MKTCHLIAGLALLIGGCAFELDTALDTGSYDDLGFSSTWTERSDHNPMTSQEQLAVQAVEDPGKPVIKGNLTASILLFDPPFSVVGVVQEKASRGEKTYTRTLYRMEGFDIIANTFPEQIHSYAEEEEDKPKREEAARAVAIQAKTGNLPLMPVLWYTKYTYYAKYDGSCTVTVNEKNIRREPLATYFIDVCGENKY